MPMLLEDLAEETSASNRRVADRLEAEIRNLEDLRQALDALTEGQHKAIDSARQATAYALSRVSQVEGGWRLALAALRGQSSQAEQERLLRTLLNVFESCLRLVQCSRVLWTIAEKMGATKERLDELDQVEKRFEELAAEAKL